MSIWSNKQLSRFNEIPSIQLTRDEGYTDEFEAIYDGTRIIIKNEILNPNNSFKDRSLAYQISYYVSRGIKKFVISSSGNAGISAASYVSLTKDGEIDVFVSNKILPTKRKALDKLISDKVRVHYTNKPKSEAIIFSRKNNILNLRGSLDDVALTGFKTIAYEIAENHRDIDALFLPTSSGTSALALHYGFLEMNMNIPIFICQSQKVHTIAMEYDKNFRHLPYSLADAIVDKVAFRKNKLIEALNSCNGGGYVVNDRYILYAEDETTKLGYSLPSYTSLLAFGGLTKSLEVLKDKFPYKLPLILVSGL